MKPLNLSRVWELPVLHRPIGPLERDSPGLNGSNHWEWDWLAHGRGCQRHHVDTQSHWFLVVGVLSVHCRMVSRNPDLFPLDTSGQPQL